MGQRGEVDKMITEAALGFAKHPQVSYESHLIVDSCV